MFATTGGGGSRADQRRTNLYARKLRNPSRIHLSLIEPANDLPSRMKRHGDEQIGLPRQCPNARQPPRPLGEQLADRPTVVVLETHHQLAHWRFKYRQSNHLLKHAVTAPLAPLARRILHRHRRTTF
ncbi:MAG: hypothetical protein H7144_17800 [Burkholderiales bacterium]|nr:hypothetical protein [Phycisphaerae bacterium]